MCCDRECLVRLVSSLCGADFGITQLRARKSTTALAPAPSNMLTIDSYNSCQMYRMEIDTNLRSCDASHLIILFSSQRVQSRHSVEETSRTLEAISRSFPYPGPVSAFGDSAGCHSHRPCLLGLHLVPGSVSMCLLLCRKTTSSESALSLLYCCSIFIYLVLNHVFTLLSTLNHSSLEPHPLSLGPVITADNTECWCPCSGPSFQTRK